MTKRKKALMKKKLIKACNKIGLFIQEHHFEPTADAIIVDKPMTDYLLRRNGNFKGVIIEVSKYKPNVQFDDDHAISCVFDIETVNKSKSMKSISDKVVTIYMNTCVGTSIIDRLYLTIVMPKLKSSDLWVETTETIAYNKFSELYRNLITAQYVSAQDTDGKVRTNIIHCNAGEVQLIRSFVKILNFIRPHYTVTFNGEQFDWPFIIRAGFKYDINVAKQLSIFREEGPVEFLGTNQITKSKSRFKENQSGFIGEHILKLDYDSLFPSIHLDLRKYNKNKGSLNEICKDLLGLTKVDLNYHDIPRALYSGDECLFRYNKNDNDITNQLYFAQYFQTNKYYTHLENICGVPRDLSACEKRSVPTSYMNYCTNARNTIVEQATVKPKTKHVKFIFKELTDYFLTHSQTPRLEDLEYPESKQLLSDYHNGALKVNNDWRKFPPVSHNIEYDSEETINLLKMQIENCNCERGYTTIDLLTLLSYLSNSMDDFNADSFDSILRMFMDFYQFNQKKPEERLKRIKEEQKKLLHFAFYVVITYKHFSPFQNAELLWVDYDAYFKNYTTGG